jgi:hypothetical protein
MSDDDTAMGTTDAPTDETPDEPEVGTPDEPMLLYRVEDEDPDEHHGVDPDELVGPGKFPLRIQPAVAIAPGTADAKRLLAIWFVRKSFYWLFFLAVAIGLTVALARHEETDLDLGDPGSLTGVWSLLLIALAVRFVSGWIALAMTLPLVFAHEPNLSPRENFGSSIGLFFDRLHIATAFRELRWTHHVRQVAQHRLGDTGRRLGKLDPILDVVNISMGVAAFVVPVIVASIVKT